MRHCFAPAFIGAAVFTLPLFNSSTAFAGLDACGDIHVEASAECSLEVEGGCEVMCEPVAFEASCAAELKVDCNGMCDADLSAECQGSCDIGGCQAECEADPGAFDCEAECTGSCTADCGGECSASCEGSCSVDCEASCQADCEAEAGGGEASAQCLAECQGSCTADCEGTCQGECTASCEANCSGECSGRCEVEPPSASCEARCEASCEGQCQAEANLECQVACQSEGYAECKARLEGGCKAECQRPEGALFCDGQYVDHGGNLKECTAALQAALNIQVEGSASASCEGGSCEAQAEGSVSACSTAPHRGASWAALGLLLAAGCAGAARRRR